MNFKFLFLDGTDTTGESQIFYCDEGKSLTLQVKNLGNSVLDVEVDGLTDADGDFQTLAVTNLGDLTTDDSIAAEGIYRVSLDGIMQIKVKNNGTAGDVKAFGVMTTY